jgi:hypothetical protein
MVVMATPLVDRYDPPRLILAGVASVLSILAIAAVLLDPDLVALWVPILAILLGQAIVHIAFAVIPSGRSWSSERRGLARVTALVWVGLTALTLGLAGTSTACACYDPDHIPRLLLGIPPFLWIALASVASPALLTIASLPGHRVSTLLTPRSGDIGER